MNIVPALKIYSRDVSEQCVPAAVEFKCVYRVPLKLDACQGVSAPTVFPCLLAGVPVLNFRGCLLTYTVFRASRVTFEK